MAVCISDTCGCQYFGAVCRLIGRFLQHACQSFVCQCGMDDNCYDFCSYDDARIVVFLRGHGKGKKCNFDNAAEFYRYGFCKRLMGGFWFRARFWRRSVML